MVMLVVEGEMVESEVVEGEVVNEEGGKSKVGVDEVVNEEGVVGKVVEGVEDVLAEVLAFSCVELLGVKESGKAFGG